MEKNTLLTISRQTGYSISTVSRVLAGKGREYRISDKAIAIIKKCAADGNYTPNLIAKGLRMNKTDVVGLLVPSIANPFFASFSSIISSGLRKAGYNIILIDSMETEELQTEAIDSFLARKVDGMIVVPVGTSPQLLESVSRHTPVVLIDRYYPDTRLPYVCTDNYSGGYVATSHLISRGYRRLLAIQGVQSSMPNRERIRGFHAAISAVSSSGMSELVTGDDFSEKNGYDKTMQAFRSGFRPDAIFAFSTTIMLGSIRAIKELGLRIPDDVAIISFDDNEFLDYLDPPVTRIAQPMSEIGHQATDILLKMMADPEAYGDCPPQILIRPSLVEGRSC